MYQLIGRSLTKCLCSVTIIGVKRVFATGLKVVFRSETTAILEMPNPGAYFTSLEGSCQPSFVSLDEVKANCQTAGTILRRELYMPGWRAIDQSGKDLPLVQNGSLFQAVKVTQDTRSVKFAFSPPHIGWAYLSFALAAMIIILNLAWPNLRPDK